MLHFSCAQHQQPCLFKGAHRMLWKPSGASGLAHFSKMPFCRLRTGIGVFFLCVISLYDCTCQWDYILCHLFILVCKCWYCITCDLLRFFSSVKLCEQRAFWEIYVLLLNTSIFGELGQHKPIALGSISVFQWDSHYFALGGALGEWLFFIKCDLFLSAWLWLFRFLLKSKASFLTD